MRADQLISPHGVPERLFGLGPIVAEGPHAAGSMELADWMRHDDGRAAGGTLGVVLDVIVGQPTLFARPDGRWPVTTELSVDVSRAPDPADGRVLLTGDLVGADDAVALSRGDARALDGTVLALATVRTRYVPGVPDLAAAASRDAATLPPGAASLREVVGGTVSGGVPGEADPAVRRLTVPPGPALYNPAGHVHGGMLVCLADVLAQQAWHRPDAVLRTAGIRFSYLRSGTADGPLVLTARAVHRGRTTALVDVEAVGGDGRVCAVGRVTALAPGTS